MRDKKLPLLRITFVDLKISNSVIFSFLQAYLAGLILLNNLLVNYKFLQ